MSSFARTWLLAAALSVCAAACERETEAQGVTLTWLPPTEFEDGRALPPGSLTEYRIYVGEDRVATVAPDRTEYFLELPPGEYRITARLRDSARTDGWDYTLTEDVVLEAGRYMTVTFKAETGGFSIR